MEEKKRKKEQEKEKEGMKFLKGNLLGGGTVDVSNIGNVGGSNNGGTQESTNNPAIVNRFLMARFL